MLQNQLSRELVAQAHEAAILRLQVAELGHQLDETVSMVGPQRVTSTRPQIRSASMLDLGNTPASP